MIPILGDGRDLVVGITSCFARPTPFGVGLPLKVGEVIQPTKCFFSKEMMTESEGLVSFSFAKFSRKGGDVNGHNFIKL